MRAICALTAAVCLFLSAIQLFYFYCDSRLPSITNLHTVALPLIHNNAAGRLTRTRIAIFYNVYSSPSDGNTIHTEKIVNEQLETWRRSGIARNATLFYALLGKEIDMPCTPEETCIRLENINPKGSEEETLQALHDYCLAHVQDRVVYMHTKGSFHDSPQNTILRQFLTNAIFSDACLAFGTNDDECDVCSARFSPLPHWHTPGNMWIATCGHVRKLLAPKEFTRAVSRVVHEATKTFHWRPPNHLSHNGQDRYANEHWVHTHPQIKPCDLYTGDYLWGYTLNLEVDGSFQRDCAPRFPRKKYGQMHPQSANWTDLAYRLFEMYLLYQQVPSENSWVWDFYIQDYNNDSAKGLLELQQWNATVWNSVPSQYQLLVQQENTTKRQKEIKVQPIVKTTIAF
jgi:hypothetical protein